MNKSVVKPMKKAEVEKSLKTMKKGVIAIRRALTSMKLGKAHEDYDFDSFKELLNKVVIPEIDYSYDSCNDQANAGEIEYNVGGKEFIGVNSYSALEPLIRAKLESACQKEIFQHIQEKGDFDSILDIPKGYISRKVMDNALAKLGYVESNEKSAKRNTSNSEGSSPSNKGNSSEASDAPNSEGSSTSKKGNNLEVSDSSNRSIKPFDGFYTSLIDWMDFHEELDKDAVFDFFECMEYKLSEEDDFEDLISNVVENTMTIDGKKSLCLKLLNSFRKRIAKKVIRSFRA